MDPLNILVNFLNFDTGKRSVSEFDISSCYRNMSSLTFQLQLPGKCKLTVCIKYKITISGLLLCTTQSRVGFEKNG